MNVQLTRNLIHTTQRRINTGLLSMLLLSLIACGGGGGGSGISGSSTGPAPSPTPQSSAPAASSIGVSSVTAVSSSAAVSSMVVSSMALSSLAPSSVAPSSAALSSTALSSVAPSSTALSSSSSLASSSVSSLAALSSSSASSMTSNSSSPCVGCELVALEEFKNALHYDDTDLGICFAIDVDTASATLLETYIERGAETGNCPEQNYYARCNYFDDDYTQAIMHFTFGFAVNDSLPTCGANAGLYTNDEGTIDTRIDGRGEVFDAFIAPFYRDIKDTQGRLLSCMEMESNGLSAQIVSMWRSSGIILEGNCPERDYIGVCYALVPDSEMKQATYWLGGLAGDGGVGNVDIACTLPNGAWVDL